MSDEQKLSKVDKIKRDANYLRGDIAQELVDGEDKFGGESIQLLKHHGTYQQDDRDLRKQTKTKHYIFMVRTAIPGGKLTAPQLAAELDLCDEIGNATLRITTRQGLQLHGVLKQNLQKTIKRINDVQLTTLAACGDVERNVMSTPAPFKNTINEQLQDWALKIAVHLRPRSRAYHEIWLADENGEKELVAGGSDGAEVEPIYGKQYLPRKFKTGLAAPEDNNIDVYSHDLGVLALHKDGHIEGFNLLVGGGMGVTPSAAKTFPAVAKPLCYVRPDQLIDAATAIVKVQRDFGNRTDRKVARLKYLIHNWGMEKFKAKVEEYYGGKLDPPQEVEVEAVKDHLGWYEQGDGRWFYGLYIENGRIKDEGKVRLKTAIRKILYQFQPNIRLTAHQNLLFCDIEPKHKQPIEEVLREHGVMLSEDRTPVRRLSMACPALPTCGLAVTESERVMPSLMDDLDAELKRIGLEDEVFTVHMTGCPNGCARPYNCDVGLVGKTLGKYTIFVGGSTLGHRLNFIYKDLVPEEEVVSTLAPLLEQFKNERQNGESFGDFCHRLGPDRIGAEVATAAAER